MEAGVVVSDERCPSGQWRVVKLNFVGQRGVAVNGTNVRDYGCRY